jgi:hypothetical protein
MEPLIGGAMKKLLFLLGCLLLLLAPAAPASADTIHWEVILNFHDTSSQPLIVRVNETQKTWLAYDVTDDNWPPLYTSVPATATDVRVGHSTAFVNRGNMAVFAKSFFQRMTVFDPKSSEIVDVDESTSQSYWSVMYRYNSWTMENYPDFQLLPYNPRIGAGMWAMDWMVRLLPSSGTATLAPGTYTITYADMLKHRCADPMFPGRVPGGEGYPPIGGPWGWGDNGGPMHFEVAE